MYFRHALRKLASSCLSEINGNNVRRSRAYFTTGKLLQSEPQYRAIISNSQKFSNEQLETLLSQFTKTPDKREWDDFRKTIFDLGSTINEKNIDATVMGYFISNVNLDFAKSYISYLQNNGIRPNIATVGKLLRTYYAHYQDKDEMSPEDLNAILQWTDQLIKLGTLDSITAEGVVHGLALTDRWEQCLKYIEMIKITARPSALAFSIVANSSFRHGKPEVGWKILDEMLDMDRPPRCSVYTSWLKYCLKCFEKHKDHKQLLSDIEKMLNFVAKNDLYISKAVAQKYMEVFKTTLGWNGKATTVINGCRCQACNRTLQPIMLSETDFKKLQKEFISKVLIRKDIYLRSSPEELKRFREHLSKTAPYDVVIDGLNVAYTTGKKNPVVLANTVSSVLQHFLEKDKKVLILGRKHMLKWPQKNLQFYKQYASMFLTDNMSQDDPFLLHAAISSGPDTCFVSRDLMRGHRFLLEDPDIKETFRKWQMSHQFQVEYVKPNGEVVFKVPLRYLPSAQRSKTCWHIPYVPEYTHQFLTPLEPPTDWICLQQDSAKPPK